MQEEEVNKIGYKIEADRIYKVFRDDRGGYTFYKIGVSSKNYDGTKRQTYKQVRFKKGIEVANGQSIKIKKGFEDFRDNPKDPYNSIFDIFILDFETVEDPEFEKKQALEKYQASKIEEKTPYDFTSQTEPKSYYENFGEFVQIEEEELPF